MNKAGCYTILDFLVVLIAIKDIKERKEMYVDLPQQTRKMTTGDDDDDERCMIIIKIAVA